MRGVPAICRCLLVAGSVGLSGCNDVPQRSVGDDWSGPRGTWSEVWRDDFDGPAGAAPDPSNWLVEVRPHGQNQELDYDTDRRENSFLDGQGNLVLRAIAEHFVDSAGLASPQPYTSARLTTAGMHEWRYGKFEARIQLPPGGKGVWPAFWLLGSSIEQVGWPKCGEVDIMEMAGSRPHEIKGSLHGPGYAGSEAFTRSFDLADQTFGEAFHTFTLEWTAEGMRWLVDGHVYHARTPEGLAALDREWVFDGPVHLILNLAIGGLFDGNPDEGVTFPQDMLIDYVSVATLESN